MKNNIFLKLLSSWPMILVFLYFIPFLGICLILLRYLVYSNKRSKILIPIFLIGVLILIPKGLSIVFGIMKLNTNIIPYFNDIVGAELYSVELIKYGKFLLTLGIIFLIMSFVFKNLFNKFENFIRSYINSQEKINTEISKKNDLIMKEKQEKAKNTHVVYCPYCGADNILTSKIGTCKYCRRQIQAKN